MLEKNMVYNVCPIDEEHLEKNETQLAKALLEFDSFSDEQYEDFIVSYVDLVANRNKLCETTFIIDEKLEKEEPETKAYVIKEFQHIWFTPQIFRKTNFENMILTLITIEHEFTHLYDYKYNPANYLKFSNENGQKPRLPYDLAIPELHKISKLEVCIDVFSNVIINTSELETHARSNALTQIWNLYNTTRKICDKHSSNSNIKLLKKFREAVRKKDDVEEKIKKVGQGFFNKYDDFKLLKAEWQNEIENYCDVSKKQDTKKANNFEKFIVKNNRQSVFTLLQIEEFSNQEDIDKLFNFWNQNPLENCDEIVQLVGLPNNTKSKKQIYEFYSKTLQDFGDYAILNISESANKLPYPKNCFEKNYFMNYYKKFCIKNNLPVHQSKQSNKVISKDL